MLGEECEVDGRNQAEERHRVVPAQVEILKDDERENAEDDERDDLLRHLQLNQREGAAVALEADAVCRHLEAVLQQRHAPREEDDHEQRPRRGDARGLQF